VGVGVFSELGGGRAKPITERPWCVDRLAVETVSAAAKLAGMFVGADGVAAAGNAAVKAGRVFGAVAQSQCPLGLVVAQQ